MFIDLNFLPLETSEFTIPVFRSSSTVNRDKMATLPLNFQRQKREGVIQNMLIIE
jgi:hypothetical protein